MGSPGPGHSLLSLISQPRSSASSNLPKLACTVRRNLNKPANPVS
uniref:Uncharacterized protein n=1 Tax=Anguilla anguilla TaxID=7936 RepID=A0A0E9PHD3_ANGAN